MEELTLWIKENGLDCQINGNLISVKDFGNFLYIKHKEGLLVDESFLIILDDEEQDFIEDHKEDLQFVVFKFGEDFYYTKMELVKNQYNELAIKPKFNDFLNIGNYKEDMDKTIEFVNLGIHTGYELLNGSGEPDEYVKKAKFFRQKFLGIAELDTLASSLAFQMSCKKNHITPIIGESISVAYDYTDGVIPDTFELKFYVKNQKGWRTLLNISKVVNVDYNKFIPLEKLKDFKTRDLICVISTNSFFNYNINNKKKILSEIKTLKTLFGKNNVYYQLDLSEYNNDDYDMERLDKIKKYIDSYYSFVPPVYIQDTYVVNKKDKELKTFLNKVSKKVHMTNDDCYMKSVDEIFNQYSNLFESNEEALDVFLESLQNTTEIAEICSSFEIEVGKPKLPDFPVKGDKEDFYLELIAKGIEEKLSSRKGFTEKKMKKYIKRIQTENEIILGAELVDYFLILWDVVEWCKKENILVGVGRGSAGGSLVAYLLGITNIDPVEYNLLFERFLNKTRTLPETKFEVKMDNGKTYLIPEDFYNKNIKDKKEIKIDLKEFEI